MRLKPGDVLGDLSGGDDVSEYREVDDRGIWPDAECVCSKGGRVAKVLYEGSRAATPADVDATENSWT